MGPLTKFARFTTQSEPALTIGVIAAIILYAIDKYAVHLTDDDAQLLGLMLMVFLPLVVARFRVYSPASVAAIKEQLPPGG